MNLFDKIGNYINEAVINASNASIYKQLGSWTAVDRPLTGQTQGGPVGKPKKGLEQQAAYNLFKRNADFDRIDALETSHLA